MLAFFSWIHFLLPTLLFMEVDLETGQVELRNPRIILGPGMRLRELEEKSVVAPPEVTAEMFRDSEMRIMERSDFEKSIAKSDHLHTLQGMTVMLTVILKDDRLASLAFKNADSFGDDSPFRSWDLEKKRHNSHRMMLTSWLGPPDLVQRNNAAWDFLWGRIGTYYDEIYWGAAIFLEYRPHV